jgi:hypothetical protein
MAGMNLLLSLLLFVAPIKPETGQFTIYVDGKKMGTEDYRIVPQRGGYLVEGRTVIAAGVQSADLKSRMELDEALLPKTYEFESRGNVVKLKVDVPLSELEYMSQGKKQSDTIRFPKDGAIIDSNFFHHYALLLYRLGAAQGSSTVSAFVPQALVLGQMTIRNLGNRTYEMDTSEVKVKATMDMEGKLIRLEVPAAKVVVER